MIGAIVEEAGRPPRAGEVGEPQPGPGEALIRVAAAGLNPVDLAIASGRFYAPVPDPPYVAGAEAVGTVEKATSFTPGTRVWALCMTGALGELVVAPEDRLVSIPEGVSDADAVLAGIAGLAGWCAMRGRGSLAAGESAVVLGASGVAGQVAIQAARAAGARRVVGVARDAAGLERARRAGADHVMSTESADLAAELRAACDGGVDVVLDGLWGSSAVAAVAAMAAGGRLVQVGNSASPEASLPGGPLRGGRLDIRGFSVFSEPRATIAAAYAELCAAIRAGVVSVPVDELPLSAIADAWGRLAAGSGGVKLVVRPG